MRLVKLIKARYEVVAPAEEGSLSEVARFLAEAPADMQASARGIYVLLQRYAQDGRQRLTSDNFHEANKPEGIWQFIKGRLRVFCFMDAQGGLVVLSHCAIKKTQKADSQEVDRAIRLKKQYETAQKEGSIQLVELD